MSERAVKLLDAADAQIRGLIDLFSASGDAALRLPCPDREKLGDGTVGACALHTAERYDRIAAFIDGRGEGRRTTLAPRPTTSSFGTCSSDWPPGGAPSVSSPT
jgi:hypothetical protein